MHLVYPVEDPSKTLFYSSRRYFSRVYSLRYIFRKLRIQNNLTKSSLAAKFGVSEEYISAIESGSKFPSLKYCLFCAKLYGANPYWVKTKWAKECIERFSERLNRRLGFDQ